MAPRRPAGPAGRSGPPGYNGAGRRFQGPPLRASCGGPKEVLPSPGTGNFSGWNLGRVEPAGREDESRVLI